MPLEFRKPENVEQDMLDVKLVVVGGATENDEFQVSLPSVFGRSRDSSIPLPHPLVSRLHCELFERQGQLMVRDLGSTNGTFVGSERITESVIQHGELLTIGTVTFRALLDGKIVPLSGPDLVAARAALPRDVELETVRDAVQGCDTKAMQRIDTAALKASGRLQAEEVAGGPVPKETQNS